ncbi:MAG: PilZ domain-containing protein [Phycisphaerales bacterium]|jgi:CheY-like chemotaxis protein
MGVSKNSNSGKPMTQEAGRPNTLNLQSKSLDSLLDMLDAAEGGSNRRRYTRWSFRHKSVELRIVQNGGGTSIKVAARNLSREGVSLLHSCFMHTGTPCQVMLPHPKRGPVAVRGKIVRCVHRGGTIHELGIKFDEPVDARGFAGCDPLCNTYSFEKVPSEELSGACVLISDSPADPPMVRHYLRETQLRLSMFSTVAAALPTLTGNDVVLLSADLPDSTPRNNIGSIRDTGFSGAIVLVAPDRMPTTRMSVLAAPADLVLVKPIEQKPLLLALAECLLISRPLRPAGSSSRTAAEPWLIQGIAELCDGLTAANHSGDMPGVGQMCTRLRCLADATAQEAISGACQEVLAGIKANATLLSLGPTISKIQAMCVTLGNEPNAGRTSAA